MTDEKLRLELRAAREGDPAAFQRAFERRLREQRERPRGFRIVISADEHHASRTMTEEEAVREHGSARGVVWRHTSPHSRRHPGWGCYVIEPEDVNRALHRLPGAASTAATKADESQLGSTPWVDHGPDAATREVLGGYLTFWSVLVGHRERQDAQGRWLGTFEPVVMRMTSLRIPPECVAFFQGLDARARMPRARPCSLCGHSIENHHASADDNTPALCSDCGPCDGELF
jgi:hypothetical protein